MTRFMFVLVLVAFLTRPDSLQAAQSPIAPRLAQAFGWVVASIQDEATARELAQRYLSLASEEVFIVPVQIGSSIMHRVVIGRHADANTAIRARSNLPGLAPDDTWLVEFAEPDDGAVEEPIALVAARKLRTDYRKPASPPPATDPPDIEQTVPVEQSVSVERTAPVGVELTSGTADKAPDRPSRIESFRRNNLRMEVGYLTRFDSNIDHNEDDTDSFGFVPALLMQFRSGRIKPGFLLNYHFARHNYSGTDRWDRFSHLFVGIARPDQDGSFRLETRGEISLKGTSEDRDLSDQYQVQQDFEYRFSDDYRFHLYGTLRWKRFENVDRNEFKPNIGVELEQKLGDGRELEAGVRWETKEIDDADSRYSRWTFSLDYDVQVSATSALEFSVENRRKAYRHDVVEIEDEDFLRRDFRWKFGMTWRKQLSDRFRFATDYRYERRDSNNPEKLFDAHLIDFSLYFLL